MTWLLCQMKPFLQQNAKEKKREFSRLRALSETKWNVQIFGGSWWEQIVKLEPVGQIRAPIGCSVQSSYQLMYDIRTYLIKILHM